MSDDSEGSLPLPMSPPPISRTRGRHDDDSGSDDSDNQRPRKLHRQASTSQENSPPPGTGLDEIPYPVEIKSSLSSLYSDGSGNDGPPQDMEIPLPPDSCDNKYSPSQTVTGDLSPVTTTEVSKPKKTVAVLGLAQAKKRLQAFSAAKLAASSTTTTSSSSGGGGSGIKKISPIKGVSVFSGRSSDSSKNQPQLSIAAIKEEETKMKEIIAMNNLLSEKLKAVHTITNPEKFGSGPATAIVKPTVITPAEASSRSLTSSHEKDSSATGGVGSSSRQPLQLSKSSHGDVHHDSSSSLDRGGGVTSFSMKKQKNIRKKRASSSSSASQSRSRSKSPQPPSRLPRQEKDRRSRSRERDLMRGGDRGRDRDRRGDERDLDRGRELKMKKSKRSRSRSKQRNTERRRSKSPKGKEKSRKRSRSRSRKRKRSRSRDRKKASLSPIVLTKDTIPRRVAISRSRSPSRGHTPRSKSPSRERERKRSRSRSREKKSSQRKKSPTSSSSSKYKKEKDRERERERERKEKEKAERETEKRLEREKEEARIALEKELDKVRKTKMPNDWIEYKKFQYRPDYIRDVWNALEKDDATVKERNHSRSSSPSPSRGSVDITQEPPSSLMQSLSQSSKLIKTTSIELKTGLKRDYPMLFVKNTKQKPSLTYGCNPLSFSGYYKSRDQMFKSEDPKMVKVIRDFLETFSHKQQLQQVDVPKPKEWFAESEQVFCPSEGSKSVVISHLYSDEEVDDSPKVQPSTSTSKYSKEEQKPQRKVREPVVRTPSPPPSPLEQEVYSENSIDSVPSPLLKRRYDSDLPTSSSQHAQVEKVSKKDDKFTAHRSDEEEEEEDISSEEVEEKRRKTSKPKKDKKKKKKKYTKKRHHHHHSSSRGSRRHDRSDDERESYHGIYFLGRGGESGPKSPHHDENPEAEEAVHAEEGEGDGRRSRDEGDYKEILKHHRQERNYTIGDSSDYSTEYSSADEDTTTNRLNEEDGGDLLFLQTKLDTSSVDRKTLLRWAAQICDPTMSPEEEAQDLLKTLDDDILLQLVLDNEDVSAETLLSRISKDEDESVESLLAKISKHEDDSVESLLASISKPEEESVASLLERISKPEDESTESLLARISGTEEESAERTSTSDEDEEDIETTLQPGANFGVCTSNLIKLISHSPSPTLPKEEQDEKSPVFSPTLASTPEDVESLLATIEDPDATTGICTSNLIEIIPQSPPQPGSKHHHDKSPIYSPPPKRRSLDERLELEMGIILREESRPPISHYNHPHPLNYPSVQQQHAGMFPPYPDQNPGAMGPQGSLWQTSAVSSLPNGYPSVSMGNQPQPYQPRPMSQTVQIGDDIQIYPAEIPEKAFTISKHNSKLNPLEVQQLANYEVPTRNEENSEQTEAVKSVIIKIPVVPFKFSFVRPPPEPEPVQTRQQEQEPVQTRQQEEETTTEECTTTTVTVEEDTTDTVEEEDAIEIEEDTTTAIEEPISPIPVYVKKLPALPDVVPEKGILVVAGFRERIFDKGKSSKEVKFVDGVKPGYGTSRSEGEDDMSSPPPSQNKVLLKKRKRRKKKAPKTARKERKRNQENTGAVLVLSNTEDSIDSSSSSTENASNPTESSLVTSPPPPPKVPYPYCPLGILYQFNPPYAVLYAQAMAEYGFEITFEPTTTIPKSYCKDS